MDLSSYIIFLSPTDRYANQSEFIANIENVTNEDELFRRLSDELKFPDYFGNNWNAVYDCLCDLQWILKKGVVLVHHNIPGLPQERLKIYLDVLVDVIKSWNGDDVHHFKVVFPEDARLIVKDLIGG